MSDEERVDLSLNRAEALVLFDWLARSDDKSPAPFADQAERRVLSDVEATLESALVAPLSADYDSQLAAARAAVRDSECDGDVVPVRSESGEVAVPFNIGQTTAVATAFRLAGYTGPLSVASRLKGDETVFVLSTEALERVRDVRALEQLVSQLLSRKVWITDHETSPEELEQFE